MSKGLDRIARYLINEALVKVDDMPDEHVPEEVENVIASLRSENETLRAANSQLTDALKIETEEGRIDRREKEKLRAQLAAYKKVAEAARQQCWAVETPEQLKFNSRLISAVDELDKVVGK